MKGLPDLKICEINRVRQLGTRLILKLKYALLGVKNILSGNRTLFITGYDMIKLTRLNKSNLIVNSELIEFVEATPDTIITLTTGQKVIVRESVDEVIDSVVEFKRRIFLGPNAE